MSAGNSNDASKDSSLVNSASRIRQLLIRLRDQRSLLTANFRGRSDAFGTLLLAVNPDDNELVFDELAPIDGDRLVRLHGEFRVSGQLDGAEISFPVTVKERDTDGEIASYTAPIPQSIHYHQRRRAFRVEAPPRPNCRVVITTDEGDWFEGVLADISITGIGFRMNGDKALELSRGTRADCHIDLPDGSVETPIEIRFSQPVQGKPFSRMGAHFTRLHPSDRRRIERFVAKLQRRQLRVER